MKQAYNLWQTDGGTFVLMSNDHAAPLAAGGIHDISAYLVAKHPPRSVANLVMPAPSAVPVNKQTPVDPVVPRPHAVSGAAG